MAKKVHKRGRKIICLYLVMVLIALMTVSTVSAAESSEEVKTVDPVHQPDNYSAVLYDNTNGLPTAEANAIVQTSEGFIWIGSYGGLIRYDGNTFERMDSTTGVASVVSLFVDSRDRLWIGTNDSGLALMENGEFRIWGADDGLGSSFICSIEEDSNGTIYAGTTEGIAMVSPEDFSIKKVDDPKVEGAYVESIKRGSDGLLYCLTNADDFFTLENGKLKDYIGHDEEGYAGITSILPDADNPGNVYMSTGDAGFYYGDPKNLEKMKKIDITPLSDVMDIEKYGDQVWICDRNGIGVCEGDKFYYMDELPMSNSVNHVMADYEGNLWFTSARKGVMKVVSNQFSEIFTRYGLEPNVVNSTCMCEDKLFIGTDTGLIVIDDKSVVESVPLMSAKTASGEDLGASDLVQLLNGVRIRSIIRDSSGRIWISTWRSVGLLCYDKGNVTAYTVEDGLLSDQVRIVSEAADGSMMAACAGGLSVIKDARVAKSYTEADGIENTAALTVTNAPNGDILIGSDGGGIYIIGKDGVRNIGIHDGLSSGIVMRIKHDIKQDLFWIITSNSISYMTEDYKVTTVQKFPYSNNLDLYENSKGDMWILSSNGIYVIPSAELVANKEIKPVHYGIANGLPCITTSNSYSELTEDGDLYLSGTTGVAKVNIESSLEAISNLKQAVPFVDADGVRIYPDQSGAFQIPSNVQKLIVYGFVYNYSLTDPQVSYRLDGFEREAVTVSRSDLGPVSYTNLPGGTYSFQMELKDALGRGSNTLNISIVKQKAFYEQLWFYILVGLAVVAVITLLVHMYIRRRMRTLEIKHREEAKRERIESELAMASRIQNGMLPHQFPPFPDRKEFDIYASMEPAKEIGGDFYDYFFVDNDHLCIVIADVSGKGVPAALFMMVSKAILQSVGGMCGSASEILTKANESICSNNQEEMFVTVWIGILEISTGKLTAANAGHEYPVIRQPGGIFELLKDRHGFVVGGVNGIKYKEYEVQLEPGAKIFLYTDGVPEATDADENMFGTDRMVEALNKDPEASPEQVLKNVRASVREFVKDAEQFDDLTMLCMEYHPSIDGDQ
ncbi:MAG: SpoIIE family protein phosphatase [Parasporobacterium sp.]|nr:SpoIIE family protein phosphatase [Parasporobacterium sp.]